MGEFVKWLVYQVLDYWTAHGGLGVFDNTQGPISDVGLQKTMLVFTRPTEVPSSTRDTMETSAYWAIESGGFFGDTWDDTLKEAVEAAIGTWWTATKSNYAETLTFDSIRWYDAGTGITPPNPANRVTAVGVAGTSSSHSLPPQVCSTLTLQTASRKHWGRMYLPAPTDAATSSGTADGRFGEAYVDAVTGDWATAMAPLAADTHVLQTVWSPVSVSALGVSAYSADDVPDVQRRRRFATVGYKSTVDS